MDDDAGNGKSSVMGNAILCVIAIGFVAGIVPLGTKVFAPLVMTVQASSWEQTEGVMVSSFVDRPNRGQFRLKAEYTYQWNGTDYRSDRVFFDETVGVREDYYHSVSRDLLRHKDVENPIDVWVNPAMPDDAVIFRHIRWDKFAGSLFLFSMWIAITVGLIASLIAEFRSRPEEPP